MARAAATDRRTSRRDIMARNNVTTALSKTGAFTPKVIFDVGANIGMSATNFRESFPESKVYSFEPVSETFEKLRSTVSADPMVVPEKLALGARTADALMLARGTHTGNRIVTNPNPSLPHETVHVTTGDEYCASNGINFIDLLKIDAEGHDRDVVVGFRDMLVSRKVDYVQVECGLCIDNNYHVPFHQFVVLLNSFGYGFFGLFDTKNTMRVTGQRRGFVYGNAVFVRELD